MPGGYARAMGGGEGLVGGVESAGKGAGGRRTGRYRVYVYKAASRYNTVYNVI